MTEFITADALTALLQVVLIDLVLAGDNAVVIGLAAAGLPADQRRRAIVVGIVAATALRIVFAGVATQLLQVIGLLLAGGVLLLWVCWKMWRELREQAAHANQLAFSHGSGASTTSSPRTSRCRSTTCSRSQALRASIPTSSPSACCCRSR